MHFDTDTLLDGCMVACTRNKSVECLPPFHFCSFPRCPCDCEAHWFGAVEGEIRSLPCEDLPCHHFRSETFRHTTSWMRFQRNHICHQSRISARREPMDMCNQLTRAVDATDIERFDQHCGKGLSLRWRKRCSAARPLAWVFVLPFRPDVIAGQFVKHSFISSHYLGGTCPQHACVCLCVCVFVCAAETSKLQGREL